MQPALTALRISQGTVDTMGKLLQQLSNREYVRKGTVNNYV